MLNISEKQCIYSFSAKNAPVLRVKNGSHVRLQTNDCFSGQIRTENDLVSNIDFGYVNPATGPVYIEDANPGTVLEVRIEDIMVSDWGIVCTIPEVGPLIDSANTVRTRVVSIEDGSWARFTNEIRLPLAPMIGVIGVAPGEEAIPCGQPGDHGGNLDTVIIKRGSTVYLPVRVEGGLFALGDLHASMGDGEICGTGIEIAGHVDVRLSILAAGQINRPVVETPDAWYCIASDSDILTAIKKCSQDMQSLIADKWNLDLTDAYQLMSVVGDLQVSQACKPSPFDVVIRFRMPKLTGMPSLI